MAAAFSDDHLFTQKYDKLIEEKYKFQSEWSYVIDILLHKKNDEGNKELAAIVNKYGIKAGNEKNSMIKANEILSPVIFAETQDHRNIFLKDWEKKGYFQDTKCPGVIKDILCNLPCLEEHSFDINVNTIIELYHQLCKTFPQDDVMEYFRSELFSQHIFFKDMLKATKKEDVCASSLYVYGMMITVVYMLDKENVDEDKLEIVRNDNKMIVEQIGELINRFEPKKSVSFSSETAGFLQK